MKKGSIVDPIGWEKVLLKQSPVGFCFCCTFYSSVEAVSFSFQSECLMSRETRKMLFRDLIKLIAFLFDDIS